MSQVSALPEMSPTLGRISRLEFFEDFLVTTHRNANCGLVKLWDTIQGEMLVSVGGIVACAVVVVVIKGCEWLSQKLQLWTGQALGHHPGRDAGECWRCC